MKYLKLSKFNKLKARRGEEAKKRQKRFDSIPLNVKMAEPGRMTRIQRSIDRHLAESVIQHKEIS